MRSVRLGRVGGLLLLAATTSHLVASAAPGDALLVESPGNGATAAPAPGSGEVSAKTGGFQYQVPIHAPPGRLGMEPTLALAYSSQASLRGGIAAGWSIDLPEIRRDYTDGVLGDERWVSTLNGGQLLVAVAEPALLGFDTYRGRGDATFTRYRRNADGGVAWEARTTDGRVYRFGEPNMLDGVPDADRHRLTSVTDEHGNTITYHWQRRDVGNGFSTVVPLRIEYTANPAANIPHHAEVRFSWSNASSCFSALLPPNARWDNRGGSRTVDGGATLNAVGSYLRDTPTASFRPVRTLSLAYDASAASCTSHAAPVLILASMQESGYSSGGTVTTMPALTFTYGDPIQPPGIPKPYPGLPAALSTGSSAITESPPMLLTRMIDLDGDGRLDQLAAGALGDCTATWRRNTGSGFGAPMSITLPQELPWRDGVAANIQHHEVCTLAGQESALETAGLSPPAGLQCKHTNAWVAYRWMDVTGDGLTDLVTALQFFPGWYDPAQGATPTTTSPSTANPNCSPDEPSRDWWQNGASFRWRVYVNQGGGQLAPTPLERLSPIPLDGEGADGFVGKRGRDVTNSSSSSDYGIMDMDGDDIPDIVEAGANSWTVRKGRPDVTWEPPVTWSAPQGRELSESATTWPTPVWSHTDSTATLEDVNSDGLPDLVIETSFGIEAHHNTGAGFELQARPIAALVGDRAPSRIVIEAIDGTSANLVHGRRYAVHRFHDLDGDGLPELITNGGGGHGLVPYVHPNHGGSFHLSSSGPLVPAIESQFARASDNGTWALEYELIDIDADGVPDDFRDGALFVRAPQAPRHLLRRIDNGRGGVLRIKYESSHAPGVVIEGGGRSPIPQWVVTQLTRESGSPASPDSVTTYQYGEPVTNVDPDGNVGFRGYRFMYESTPLGAQEVTEMAYQQHVPGLGNVLWEGAVVRTETLDENKDTVSWSTTAYTALQVLGGVVHAVVPSVVERSTIVAGSGPGTGNDSPIVRVASMWQPHNVPGTPLVVAYHERRREQTVIDPSPAPLLVEDSREVTDATLVYGASNHVFRTTRQAQEVRIGATWNVSSEVLSIFSGPFIEAQETLVSPGVYARLERDHLPTGVIERTRRPMQVLEPVPLEIVTHYDAFHLVPVRTVDELGGQVHRRFDLGTGLTEAETPRTLTPTLAAGPHIETVYDGFGRPVSIWRSHFDPVTQTLVPFEVERHVYTDGPSSVHRTERRLSFDTTQWSASEVRFDGWGRTISTTDFTVRGPETSSTTYDTGGNVLTVTRLDVSDDTGGMVTSTYVRDSLGRALSLSTPGLAPTVYEYLGNAVVERVEPTDGSIGREKELVSDPVGRLRIVRELADQGVATTTYEYDGNDNVSRVTNPDGAVTELVHDALGRRTQVTRANRTWTFTYDLHGNLELEQAPVPPQGDPLDYANTYTYDAIDRQTSSRPGRGNLASGSGEALASHGITEMFYDQGCIGTFGFGELCEVELPFGTLRYGYNAEGWETREERELEIQFAGATTVIDEALTTVYGPGGDTRRIVHEDALNGSWGMDVITDGDGLPIKALAGRVGDPFTDLATLTRGRTGVVRERAGPAGQMQTWTFDPLGRVLDVEVVGNGNLITRQDVTYWETGNVRSLENNTIGPPLELDYDAQYQISGVSSQGTGYLAAFTYSPAGRVKRATVSSTIPGAMVLSRDVEYDYDPNDPHAPATALTSVSGSGILVDLDHDASGNTLSRTTPAGTVNYFYDAHDRLREAEPETGSVGFEVYFYTHDGERIASATKDGNVRVRHWFGPAETQFGAGATQIDATLHVGLAGMLVARMQRVPEVPPELVYADGLGNTLALLDTAGGATAQFAYGAFGETLVHVGPSAADYHRRFNGEEWDETTGLIHYGYRYYDPLTLQWTQPDPMFRVSPDAELLEPRAAGLYDFSLNNPLRYVDPDGLQPWSEVAAELQRDLCSDATTNPTHCPKEPSAFIHSAYEEQYGSDDEPLLIVVDEEPNKASGGWGLVGDVSSTIKSIASTGWELVAPQSATEAAMMGAGGFLGAGYKAYKKTRTAAKVAKAAKAAGKGIQRVRRYEYHHLTPRQFQKQLSRLGVDVHDYTLKIGYRTHRRIHNKAKMARLGKLDWNSAWEAELASGRLRNKADVIKFMHQMARDYNLPKGTIQRYPGRK